MKKIFTVLVLFVAFASSAQSKTFKNKAWLDELFTIMQGNYSSEKQAAVDTSYFSISLRMIPIWKNKGH